MGMLGAPHHHNPNPNPLASIGMFENGLRLKPRLRVWLCFGTDQVCGCCGTDLLVPLQHASLMPARTVCGVFALAGVALQDQAAPCRVLAWSCIGTACIWMQAAPRARARPFRVLEGQDPNVRTDGAAALLSQICSLTALAGAALQDQHIGDTAGY